MTMDSWFSDPSGGNGEDTSALWAQQEKDRLAREAAYQAGPLYQPPPAPTGPAMFGPGATSFPNYPPMQAPPIGDLIPAPPVYGPPAPEPVSQFLGNQFAAPPAPPPVGINPVQGGFRQTELQPDPNALTDNPLALLGGAYGAGNVDIPIYSDIARNYLQPAARFVGESALNTPGYNIIANQFGLPTGQQIGGTAAESMVPVGALDVGLNAAFAPKGAGLLERFTGIPISDAANEARGLAGNYARASMPEPNIGTNLSAGIPPFNPGEIPDLGQGPQMLGGELPAPGGRLYNPEAEPFRGGPVNDAYDTGAMFGYNPATPDYTGMPSRLASAPPDVQAELRQAEIAANEDAAMVRGMGQAPTPAPVAPTPSANEMQTALDNARALETGTGATPVPPPAETVPTGSPPPASSTTATLTSNATPFESAHQGLANVVETPTPPASDIAGLRDEVRQLREAVEANGAPPRWGEPPPSGGGGAGKGGAAASGGTPKVQGLLGTIRDALYTPFGFDLSSWLRQDVMRTLNPFRIGETIQVAKDSTRAIANRDFALQFEKDFADRIKALGVNMHFPDWQGGDIVGREGMYSKLLNSLPGYEALNRGFSTDIASRRINALEGFAQAHPGADLQHEANRLERQTGRGSLGANNEKALSTIGAPFTALRNAIGIPQSAASLVPFQRLTDGSFQMFGPSWRESVIDHAGFITTVAATMAAAQQAGFKVGWDPNNQTSNSGGKTPFGKIELPNGTLIDLTGGRGKYVNAALQLATGEKNGKDYPWLLEQAKNGQYKGTVAEFVRNLTGPTTQLTAAGLKEAGVEGKGLEFLRPDYWDKGVTGKGTFADRVAQFVVPLWIQDVAQAVKNSAAGNQLPSQVAAGAAAFLGAGVQTYDRQPLNDARAAVKDSPALPPELQGKDYKDLGPKGKAEVDKAAEQAKPEEYKQGKEDQKANANPVFEKYHETTTKINQTVDERSTFLYNALRDGKITGEQLRQGREIINSSAKAQRDTARNAPEYQKALSQMDKNEVGKALDAYYSIWDSTPKLPNGKPNYDAIEARQSKFLELADKKDAETGKLLRFEVNTTADRTNSLDKLYDLAKPILEKYGNIKDDYARSQAQMNNPRDDAFLALLGYGKTQSPQAAQILEQLRHALPTSAPPVAAAAGAVQRSAVPAPSPAPAPQQSVAPLPTPTGAPRTLPPVAPGEFNSAQASPQQRQNFITAMTGPANDYAYTKIPPAVFAAIGASESNYGRAPSIFGIKGVGSAGGSDLATHEIINGQRVNMNDQFAAYNNLDDAFNHFIDLTSHGRYAPAWNELQRTGDWQGFLRGITDAGYATAKNWPDSIIALTSDIERNYPQINRR